MNTKQIVDELKKNISFIIKGKDEVIELFISAFLAGGHVLLDDIPGVGKTTMVKALSKLIYKTDNDGHVQQAEFKRLQCTPDLLPYDITGVDVFNTKNQTFEFLKGPVFSDIFLADELNRTPPKVQAALLEVMEEKQVSVGGRTHKLSELFFTAATQNPVETLGTYPLPPAQLDRFMVSLSIGYPDDESALEILNGNSGASFLPELKPIINIDDIKTSRSEQKNVFCHKALLKAIIDICNATRNNSEIQIGASPRASIQLLQFAKITALAKGRTWVEDTDLKIITPHVLSHKCIYKNRKSNPKDLIGSITDDIILSMNKKTDWTKEG